MVSQSEVFNVREYGAVGDGVALDTEAIQAAIEACAGAGGGTVYLPAGTFLSGTIYLRSNTNVSLDAGAILQGSSRLEHYPVTRPELRSYSDNFTDKSLIYAERAHNISIAGWGTIDGQGAAFSGPYKARPYIMRLIECHNVSVQDLTIRDSPMWVQHYLACENVNISGVTVHSWVNLNNDGIDIDGCEKVRISNCEISTDDDAIVLKTTTDRACRDVAVTNCVLSTDCNAFKLGTETSGDFENITLDNCTMYDVGRSGIALETVDGAALDRINIANVTMRNANAAIFIRLGNRARPYQVRGAVHSWDTEGIERPEVGSLQNVLISNVQATGCDRNGCSITGLPDHPVRNVTLENIHITFEGGGTREDARREVPELPEEYPDYDMFGAPLPAYGLFCRHVRNLKVRNVDLGFGLEDQRPALVCEDVRRAEICGLDAQIGPSAEAILRLEQVEDFFIHGNRPRGRGAAFVGLDGDTAHDVVLINNDLADVRQAVAVENEGPNTAVFAAHNRE